MARDGMISRLESAEKMTEDLFWGANNFLPSKNKSMIREIEKLVRRGSWNEAIVLLVPGNYTLNIIRHADGSSDVACHVGAETSFGGFSKDMNAAILAALLRASLPDVNISHTKI